MAQPMHDPDPLEPWPQLTDEDDEWLQGLLAYLDDLDGDNLTDATDVADGRWNPDDPDLPEHMRRAARWTVTDDGSAEWAMAKYATADAELARLQAQAAVWQAEAEERLARIRQWFDHRARRHQATKAFMEAHLVRYALDRRDADPKHNKTLVLPSGAVKTTEQQPKAAVADEAALVAWVTCWYPQAAAEVCPPVPPKVYVRPLRELTTVVEVIDHARLVLANSAEVLTWVRNDYQPPDDAELVSPVVRGDTCPGQGDGWPDPETATDLVAMVQVLASHPEVRDPDGRPMPGTTVEPGSVTAKVVPA